MFGLFCPIIFCSVLPFVEYLIEVCKHYILDEPLTKLTKWILTISSNIIKQLLHPLFTYQYHLALRVLMEALKSLHQFFLVSDIHTPIRAGQIQTYSFKHVFVTSIVMIRRHPVVIRKHQYQYLTLLLCSC